MPFSTDSILRMRDYGWANGALQYHECHPLMRALRVCAMGGGSGGSGASENTGGAGGGEGGEADFWLLFPAVQSALLVLKITIGAGGLPGLSRRTISGVYHPAQNGHNGGHSIVEFPLALSVDPTKNPVTPTEPLRIIGGGAQGAMAANSVVPGQGGRGGDIATNTDDQGHGARFPTGAHVTQTPNRPGGLGMNGQGTYGGFGAGRGNTGGGGDGAWTHQATGEAGFAGYAHIEEWR